MKKKLDYLVAVFVVITASMGWAETPDYGSSSDQAESISANGTMVQGTLDTDDEDWFTFSPTANTLYRVTMTGEINKGYKYMDIYQTDEFGNLHRTIQHYTYSNGTSTRTFFLETDADVYIKQFYSPGNYSFYVESVGQFLPDSYADECDTATGMTVDAAPIDGTLTHNPDDSLEADWFVFDTQPLHMYQITLTKSDNTDLNFRLYSDDCTYLLDWSKSRTVTSWFGEQYRILVAGNPDYLGTYYTIEVVDLGLLPDDYPNVSETAVPITADGTIVEGEIQFDSNYGSDEDWFTFKPTANTLYRVTMTGEVSKGYKYMDIYQADAFGNLRRTIQHYAYSDGTSAKTFFLETDDDVYVKLFYNNGHYSYAIETLGQYLPDSYADACAEATALTVDANPTEGTLDHNPDNSLEADWFVFDTQPLHMYQVTLTKSDNTDLNFRLYSDDCDYLLDWSKSRTVTSWTGEQYRIYVAGNPDYLGTYYTISVVDMGLFPDDYPNIPDNAMTIQKDGTVMNGEIQYSSSYGSDEDWFTFIAGQDGDYQFSLTGEVGKGYKYIRIMWEDELGVLREKKNTYAYSDGVNNFTVTLPAGRIFLQLYYNLGSYSFSVVSPEPRCGDLDHPYPDGDANKDCYVNMEDLAMMAANWLTCSAPNPPCIEMEN